VVTPLSLSLCLTAGHRWEKRKGQERPKTQEGEKVQGCFFKQKCPNPKLLAIVRSHGNAIGKGFDVELS
jgi:hypothetical protein